MLIFNYGEWSFWEAYNPSEKTYGNQKVTFDGVNKLILVNPDVVDLDIKEDVYSNWKEWVTVQDYSKYPQAIRATGGDPISGTTTSTGDVYFLTNGWRLIVDLNKLKITGVLYSDDFPTAFYDENLNALFPVSVSALVLASSGGTSGPVDIDPESIWSYSPRTLTGNVNANIVSVNSTAVTSVDDFKANSVDLSPVLSAIAALNDLSLAEVEGSLVIAKEASSQSIITAISGLNDVTPAEVRAAFNAVDFQDKNTELEIHTWLDSYANKDNWKASSVDLTPVLAAVAALNDLSLAEVEGSTVIAKQATLSLVGSAVTNLNDVTAAEVRAAFNEADFKDKNTELEIHTWLDSYMNKDAWKGDGPTDLTPVLNAIAALNDISLLEIEGSTVLATQASLVSIANDIAQIPTTDSVADLTPVLAAIAALNDVTPAEVRAAFNEADFKDKNTELEIHTWLDSYTNKNAWMNVADLTPVLSAIAALNDVTATEVRAAFNSADFKDKNTELEIHTWLDSYLNKDDWKGASSTDVQPVLDAIAALNDVSLLEIEGSTVLSKEATLTAVAAAVAAIPTNPITDISPIMTAISNLNDVTAGEVRAAFNAVEFQDKNTEIEIHAWLDSYVNKDAWKGSTGDLTPILNAINALNDISVLDIEGSTILAKEATLATIATAIAQIPTTDSVADLTPVLSAIASLNDVTPVEVRAAFNEADFKDKNTQAEIHAWLDSYLNKDDWKGMTAAQELKISNTNVLVNGLDTKADNIKSTVDTLPTLTDIDNSTVLAKKSDVDAVNTIVSTLPTLANIEGSTVLAKKSDVTVVEDIVNQIPVLSEIRDEMVNVQFGALEITNNQMIVKDKQGVIIAILDLFDKNGNPTMLSVFKREVVS